MQIFKADKQHKTAVFVVLEPETIDRNGDIVSEEVITKAAHEFMMNLPEKAVNMNHKKNTDTEEAVFVESYILPVDIEGEDDDGNSYTIKAGSWLVGIKFSDNMWEKLMNGEFTGISLEGRGDYVAL